jgi:hypothetical protein
MLTSALLLTYGADFESSLFAMHYQCDAYPKSQRMIAELPYNYLTRFADGPTGSRTQEQIFPDTVVGTATASMSTGMDALMATS